MTLISFVDTAPASNVRETSDGYLVADARVGRTGIQVYRGSEVGMPDKAEVRVYRPKEEVFSQDAMRSLANKPVTLDHPPESVGPANWSRYAKGIAGNEVVRDGEFVRVPLVLMDSAAINAFKKQNVRELSIGYTTELLDKAGVTEDGEPYDAVQTQIRANHIALVPNARGGERLRFGDAKTCPSCGKPMTKTGDKYVCDCGASMPVRDNGDDDYMSDAAFTTEERRDLAKRGLAKPDGSYPIRNRSDLENAIKAWGRGGASQSDKDWIIKRAKALKAEADLPADWLKSSTNDGPGRQLKQGKRTMDHIVMIGDAKIEVADALSVTVINSAFKKLQDETAAATAAKAKAIAEKEEAEQKKTQAETDSKKAMDAKDGEIAALKQRAVDAESKVAPANLNAIVAERTSVIDAAAKVIGSDKGLREMDNGAIKRAAVVAKLGDTWKDAKVYSDDSVDGAFKAISVAPTPGNNGMAGVHALADSFARFHAASPGGMSLTDAAAARDKAYAERDRDMQDAWRNPGGGKAA